MTITLSPDLASRLSAAAAAAGLSPDEMAERLIAGGLFDHAQALKELVASLDEAEAEAEREGWLDGETVFQELFARLERKA